MTRRRHAAALDAVALADHAWTEVRPGILLVPLGSTEPHGPHLPVDTDAFIATAVAHAVAERLATGVAGMAPLRAVVAPTLPFGTAGAHRFFAGAMSIGAETLAALLVDLGRSASDWAEQVVLVTAYAGDAAALRVAVPALRGSGREVCWTSCLPFAPVHEEGAPPDAHAGRGETSLMLALAPERVRRDRVVPGGAASAGLLLPDVVAPGDPAAATLDDPTRASAAEGEQLFEGLVGDVLARLAWGFVGDDGQLARAGVEQA